MFAWVFFIFGVCCLYFGSIRELNHDCPSEYEETYELLEKGWIAGGGAISFIGVFFAIFYYSDSMQVRTHTHTPSFCVFTTLSPLSLSLSLFIR